MEIIKKYARNFKRFGQKRTSPLDSIEMHSIGTAQNTAINVYNSMNQYNPGGIVHAIIPADESDSVLEILPNDNVAWADAGYGNQHSFTIEICESDYMKYQPNSARFTITNEAKFLEDIQRGYDRAVEYVAVKCKEFGFDPMKKLSNGLYQVYSHQEANKLGLASAHVDPVHIWPYIDKDMDKFRKEVKQAMGEYKEEPNIKGVVIGNSNVEAISKVVYGEAGIIKSMDALVAVAQCIKDMLESGQWGKTITEVMQKNFSAYGNQTTTDEARQAVYDVFVNGKTRFADAKIFQFRSFTKYSDGKGNMDPVKCASLLQKYEYLGKDARDNKWGHLYFGKKIAVSAPEEKKQTYRVRLKWGNDMTTQIGAFTNLDKAIECAKAAIPGYKVFDEAGKIVFDTGKLTVENQREIAIKWAQETANNNAHGYNNTKGSRGGNPDYACSSFVNEAWRQAGVELPKSETVYTKDMQKIYTKVGFEIITDEVNVKTGKGLIASDVVLKPVYHTELYLGNGMLAGARGNANSGKPENGKAGDQSGNEITVSGYYNYPWTIVLRYVGINNKEETPAVKEETSKEYVVQAGKFSNKENAEKLAANLKKAGFDAIIK